ncbi:hypothetical protein [Caldifermentibacillus hisashii]|uniref:hypothetical protein n=1 Tax=Caldifermentibacillus hisashii TaxID=996558 RepID=UPI0031B68F23
MSSVLKNGSYDDLKVSEINKQLEIALAAKDQAIAYNAVLENLLYKAKQEIIRLNEEINNLTRK